MKRPIVLCLIALAITLAFAPKCTICDETQWGYAYGAFDHYDVRPTDITAKGIMFDPSGMPIAPALIDRLTDEVEACLSISIIRTSFVVKVANDWIINCDGTQQLLPVLAGSAGCIAKGLTPSEQCPCRWRAGIECPNAIVTTPSFYLYKDALTRFVTGNMDPWASPELAVCASPSTTPLSDGTDPNNGL